MDITQERMDDALRQVFMEGARAAEARFEHFLTHVVPQEDGYMFDDKEFVVNDSGIMALYTKWKKVVMLKKMNADKAPVQKMTKAKI